MNADIVFRYYEYDPMCATFTYWNGYRCKPNYSEYCASLTEDKKRQFINKSKKQGIELNMTNINFTVTYNKVSKACQINVVTVEKNTVEVEVPDNIPVGPQTVEVGAKEYFREQIRKQKKSRKVQAALMVMCAFIVVGIIGYKMIAHYHRVLSAA